MNRHHRWLHRELPLWVEEGLLSAAQSAALQRRYPAQTQGWGQMLLSGMGAVLLGLGVILLFAYNWAEMPRGLKLGLLFGGLLLTHLLALRFHHSATYPRLAEGLHLLGTMLFGAGIWLVAQIYHIDDHYPNAFLAWGTGALLLAWALPSLAQSLLAIALIIGWQLLETFDFHWSVHPTPLLIMAGILPLALRLRSPVLASLGAAAMLLSLLLCLFRIDDGLATLGLLLAGTTFAALRWIVPTLKGIEDGAALGAAFALPGRIAALFVLYLLTSPELITELLSLSVNTTVERLYLGLLLGSFVAAWGWVAAGASRLDAMERLQAALLFLGALLALLLAFAPQPFVPGWGSVIVLNLLFLAHALYWIFEGLRRVRAELVQAGCALLILLAGARYTDLFDSLLLRAGAFLLVGGTLFAIGNYYARKKRRMAAP